MTNTSALNSQTSLYRTLAALPPATASALLAKSKTSSATSSGDSVSLSPEAQAALDAYNALQSLSPGTSDALLAASGASQSSDPLLTDTDAASDSVSSLLGDSGTASPQNARQLAQAAMLQYSKTLLGSTSGNSSNGNDSDQDPLLAMMTQYSQGIATRNNELIQAAIARMQGASGTTTGGTTTGGSSTGGTPSV